MVAVEDSTRRLLLLNIENRKVCPVMIALQFMTGHVIVPPRVPVLVGKKLVREQLGNKNRSIYSQKSLYFICMYEVLNLLSVIHVSAWSQYSTGSITISATTKQCGFVLKLW